MRTQRPHRKGRRSARVRAWSDGDGGRSCLLAEAASRGFLTRADSFGTAQSVLRLGFRRDLDRVVMAGMTMRPRYSPSPLGQIDR